MFVFSGLRKNQKFGVFLLALKKKVWPKVRPSKDFVGHFPDITTPYGTKNCLKNVSNLRRDLLDSLNYKTSGKECVANLLNYTIYVYMKIGTV